MVWKRPLAKVRCVAPNGTDIDRVLGKLRHSAYLSLDYIVPTAGVQNERTVYIVVDNIEDTL